MTTVILLFLIAGLCGLLQLRNFRNQKFIEDRLLRAHMQLATAHDLLNRRHLLMSEMAHDIKNPLCAIKCSSEALDYLIGDLLDQDHRQSLSYIGEYADQLLRLLDNFLEFEQLKSGKIRSNKETVDIAETCRLVHGLLQAYARQAGVLMSFDCANGLPEGWIDRIHLQRILFNLIHNAIKFSDPGSEVRIATTLDIETKQLVISVNDQGVGISAERLKLIFTPYYHHHESRDGKVREGNGLGLALCKDLAELEDCDLSVTSILNQGTSFVLKIAIATIERQAKRYARPLLRERPAAELFADSDQNLGILVQ